MQNIIQFKEALNYDEPKKIITSILKGDTFLLTPKKITEPDVQIAFMRNLFVKSHTFLSKMVQLKSIKMALSISTM